MNQRAQELHLGQEKIDWRLMRHRSGLEFMVARIFGMDYWLDPTTGDPAQRGARAGFLRNDEGAPEMNATASVRRGTCVSIRSIDAWRVRSDNPGSRVCRCPPVARREARGG